jgi:hypothetical protein
MADSMRDSRSATLGPHAARLVTVGAAAIAVAVGGVSVWWSIQPAPPSPLSNAQLTSLVAPSVVRVTVTRFRGSTNLGAGFVYSTPGHVVTNSAVLAAARSISVTTSSGETLPATLIGVDRATSTAELLVPDMTATPLQKAAVPASALEPVAIASPDTPLMRGRVVQLRVAVRAYYHDQQVMKTDISLSRADIGSPLLDGKGQIVGIVTVDPLVGPTSPAVTALAIRAEQFDAEARRWALSDQPIHLLLPPVTAPASDFLLSSPPGFVRTSLQAIGTSSYRSLFDKPVSEVGGAERIDSYTIVSPSETAAESVYSSLVKTAQDRGLQLHCQSGYCDFIGGDADESSGFASATMNPDGTGRGQYELIWRDRNVVVSIHLDADLPNREVSVAYLGIEAGDVMQRLFRSAADYLVNGPPTEAGAR